MTQGLFYEFRHQTTCKTPAVYTLKDKDWEGCKSMYLIYMQCDSEYEAAQVLLGSWTHWNKLKATSWFATHLEKWNEERTIREESLAHKALLSQTKRGNVTAAKALLSGTKKPGRPIRKKSEPKTNNREAEQLVQNFKVHKGGKE